MSNAMSKNTTPEIKIRSALFSKGYRYKIHVKDLPGTPDIVMSKYKIIININGCFWHNHGCPRGTIPKTRMNYWIEKLEENKTRDFKNKQKLRQLGWRVFDVWECSLKEKNFKKTFENLEKLITGMICAA